MIPSLRLVEDIADWGVLVEIVGGEHAGAAVLVVPAARVLPGRAPPPGPGPGRRPVPRRHGRVVTEEDVLRAEAGRRAEALLESLLDRTQRADWRRRRRFWVPTPYGAVELGRISDLRFEATDGRHLVLCVVPTRHGDLPLADVWTNLLLVLRAEPDRFFDVANYLPPGGPWLRGPVPRVRPRIVPAGAPAAGRPGGPI
jgi:hypothetical protein